VSERARRLLLRAVAFLEPEANPAGAIYGTITAGALLAAESDRRETTPEAVGAVAVALVLYWLAHAYAQALGERLEDNQPFRVRNLLVQLRHSATIVRGSTLPLGAMLIAWAVGARTNESVVAALITAALSLVLLEVVAGVRGRCSRAEVATQAAVSAVLGVGVLALKVVLH
jgi:hypothetical protein